MVNSAYDGIPKTKDVIPDEIELIPEYDPLNAKNINDFNIRRELSFHSTSDAFIVRQKHSNGNDDGAAAASRDRQISNITDNTIIGST